MASGLDNLLICGGVLLLTSVANAFISPAADTGSPPDAAAAQKRFDASFEESVGRKTSIVLAPRFNGAYKELRLALLRRGLILHIPEHKDGEGTVHFQLFLVSLYGVNIDMAMSYIKGGGVHVVMSTAAFVLQQ